MTFCVATIPGAAQNGHVIGSRCPGCWGFLQECRGGPALPGGHGGLSLPPIHEHTALSYTYSLCSP